MLRTNSRFSSEPAEPMTSRAHTPAIVDEDALPMGVQIMSLAALDLLR